MKALCSSAIVFGLALACFLLSCSEESTTAGGVIDTSTLYAEIQGRSTTHLNGKWIKVYQSSQLVDSVQISENHGFELEYQSDYSLSLAFDSLHYFAYRIVPTDTIRPSALLRFLFPKFADWDSSNPPSIVGWPARIYWHKFHEVWATDSLPSGRHLVQWSRGGTLYQADLVLTEMGNRFESAQVILQAGSLRPIDCGFALFQKNIAQEAGRACPHTESDAFNRLGISTAELLVWNDSLLGFELSTLIGEKPIPNPYAKLLLEFDSEGRPYNLSAFSKLQIKMDLKAGDRIQVRLAQSNLAVGHWFYAEVIGRGMAQYDLIFDQSFMAFNDLDTLDLTKLFGLEFRNSTPGLKVQSQIYTIKLE